MKASSGKPIIMAWALLALVVANPCLAQTPDSYADLLGEANRVRTADPQRFEQLVGELELRHREADQNQALEAQYLKAFLLSFKGQREASAALLSAVLSETDSPRLKVLTGTFAANNYAAMREFGKSFREIRLAIQHLELMDDKGLSELVYGTAAIVFNLVGQYEQAVDSADRALALAGTPRLKCMITGARQEAYFKLGRTIPSNELTSNIEFCESINEKIGANFTRLYQAKQQLKNDEADLALADLSAHVEEIEQTHYNWLIGSAYSVLAALYQGSGKLQLAQSYAERAIDVLRNEPYSEPIVDAYATLYALNKQNSNLNKALHYHEEYMKAEKSFLDEVSARRLATMQVELESERKTKEIEKLNSENEVLKLQGRVAEQTNIIMAWAVAFVVLMLAFSAAWLLRIRREHAKYRKQAQIDALTQAYSRQYFAERCDQRLQQARLAKKSISLLLFDLDHFKAINDTYGHPVGDQVLISVANACRLTLTENELFGRFGGEEFVILCEASDFDAAFARAELFRRRIANIDTTDLSPQPFAITASFGIGFATDSDFSFKDLVADADANLYAAKRRGRNNTCGERRRQMHAATPGQQGSPTAAV